VGASPPPAGLAITRVVIVGMPVGDLAARAICSAVRRTVGETRRVAGREMPPGAGPVAGAGGFAAPGTGNRPVIPVVALTGGGADGTCGTIPGINGAGVVGNFAVPGIGNRPVIPVETLTDGGADGTCGTIPGINGAGAAGGFAVPGIGNRPVIPVVALTGGGTDGICGIAPGVAGAAWAAAGA